MGNLIDMFKTCENVLKGDDGNENLIDLGKSNAKGQFVNIQGQDFNFFGPSQLG